MLFTLKVGSIWQGLSSVGTSVQIPIARAAETDAKQQTTPADAPAPDRDLAAPAVASQPAPDDPAASGATGDNKTAAVVDAADTTSDTGGDVIDPHSMSRSEIRLLQALAGRRRVLDKREQSLDQREALLKAAAQQLVDKQTKLVEMRRELERLLDQLDEKEQKRISNLVKIYENMKPKKAAKIFDDLELSVLLGVVERMKVRKLAPIIAAMKTDKARAVTRALAERKEPVLAKSDSPEPINPKPK